MFNHLQSKGSILYNSYHHLCSHAQWPFPRLIDNYSSFIKRRAHPKSINDWNIQILQNLTYQTYVQVSAFHPAHKRSSTPQVLQNSREHMPQYHRNPLGKDEGFQLFTIVNLKRRVGYHRTQATNSSIFFSFHRFQSFNYD